MIKQIIVPIIIAILTIAALVLYFCLIASALECLWIKIVIIVVLVALSAAMIGVTISRIREIKREDIDDVVSKY